MDATTRQWEMLVRAFLHGARLPPDRFNIPAAAAELHKSGMDAEDMDRVVLGTVVFAHVRN